jgi:hypothetical protein
MNHLIIVTLFQTIYLFYMYFIFKTNYSFSSAVFDKQVQSMGTFFVHNTNIYENKICGFGRFMAIVAIILAFVRLCIIYNDYEYSKISIINKTLIFDIICIILAYIMNLNGFIYIIPVVLGELYIIYKLI